jgi:hypothetical protein
MSHLRLGRITDFAKWVEDAIYNIKDLFENKLFPASSFSQYVIRGVTPLAGVEFTITHNLRRGKPVQDSAGNWKAGIEFIYWLDGPGTLYESDFANWTDNAIKLKCSEANRGYTIIVR